MTDGTPAGTRLLKDIFPGRSSSEIDIITWVNGVALFMANDGVNGVESETWRSDGTLSGTRIGGNIGPGGASGVASVISHRQPFPVTNNVMYFTADDGSTGVELWRTDGTSTGTYRLTDGVAGAAGIHPLTFHVVGSRVYFLATDAEGGETGTSDGTVNGSRRVANINPSTDRHIGYMQVLGEASSISPREIRMEVSTCGVLLRRARRRE